MTDSNKVTGYIDKQTKYIGHIAVSSTNAPEAASCQCLPYQWVGNVKWTSTLSPRLLLESGWGVYNVEWDYENQDDVPLTAFRINDQITGRNHRRARVAAAKHLQLAQLHGQALLGHRNAQR